MVLDCFKTKESREGFELNYLKSYKLVFKVPKRGEKNMFCLTFTKFELIIMFPFSFEAGPRKFLRVSPSMFSTKYLLFNIITELTKLNF